jgi:hypothetical protein
MVLKGFPVLAKIFCISVLRGCVGVRFTLGRGDGWRGDGWRGRGGGGVVGVRIVCKQAKKTNKLKKQTRLFRIKGAFKRKLKKRKPALERASVFRM